MVHEAKRGWPGGTGPRLAETRQRMFGDGYEDQQPKDKSGARITRKQWQQFAAEREKFLKYPGRSQKR